LGGKEGEYGYGLDYLNNFYRSEIYYHLYNLINESNFIEVLPV
jgi:hypothetical protein